MNEIIGNLVMIAILGLMISAPFYGDLLGAALDSVDWYEIAESMLTDAKETLTHEGTT